MTITITAAVSKPAQVHSPRVTLRCDNLALIGSANSSEHISSACTSSTEPWPRFLLQIRDGVGKCTPHDGASDVKIGLGELATIYMGAHRASELLRANRITELHPGALRDLDAAFITERAPYCGTLF